ncbi:hypothetical protein, partial [Bacillus sp. ISO11]|uniref:hypothetical protein n=1 Tax=Bacillus sp. ISO11 TaxID=1826752 RepID=UPI0014038C44
SKTIIKKIIGSGLALSLLLGGAAFNSTATKAAPINEETIAVESSNENIQPPQEFFAAAGRAVAAAGAFSVGKAVGKAVANAAFGNNSTNSLDYEDINITFDY